MSKVFGDFFNSEWSFAQVRIKDENTICCFGEDNTIIIVATSGIYYKVKIHNRDFLKIKINPSESTAMKDFMSRVSKCRCSLEWLYLPLDDIKIKEGVSTEDL